MQPTDRLTELQQRKLELEIGELERPVFKRISFLSVLVPLLAALLTGLIGYLGNIELKKLRDQKAQLEQTIHELATDQVEFMSVSTSGIEAFLKNVSLYEKFERNPSALFTEAAFMDQKGNFDAFLASHLRGASLCTSYAARRRDLLGEDAARNMVRQCNEAKARLEKVQKYVDSKMGEVLDELRLKGGSGK